MASIPYILSGISIILLVIYGVDVLVVNVSGDGFLPFDAMTRGIGFGMPPIILSFVAFFMPKRPRYKGLGMMLIVTGVLIIVGGAVALGSALESQNTARLVGEGGALFGIGAIIAVLGGIEIKKSTK